MSREQAAMRPETREPVREGPHEAPRERTRKRRGDIDQFYIDPDLIPDGMSWEWKRASVYGQADRSHQMALAENGWEPVMASRYPQYMQPGYTGPIERDGMILQERPIELTQEARAEDYQNATSQVRGQEAKLSIAPSGQGPRDHKDVRPRIKKSFEPLEIPE